MSVSNAERHREHMIGARMLRERFFAIEGAINAGLGAVIHTYQPKTLAEIEQEVDAILAERAIA